MRLRGLATSISFWPVFLEIAGERPSALLRSRSLCALSHLLIERNKSELELKIWLRTWWLKVRRPPLQLKVNPEVLRITGFSHEECPSHCHVWSTMLINAPPGREVFRVIFQSHYLTLGQVYSLHISMLCPVFLSFPWFCFHYLMTLSFYSVWCSF